MYVQGNTDLTAWSNHFWIHVLSHTLQAQHALQQHNDNPLAYHVGLQVGYLNFLVCKVSSQVLVGKRCGRRMRFLV